MSSFEFYPPGSVLIPYEENKTFDNVEKPAHYNQSGIECIEAIKASMSKEEYEGYLRGSVMKYLWRYRLKGKPLEDLKKAQWYLRRLVESVGEES